MKLIRASLLLVSILVMAASGPEEYQLTRLDEQFLASVRQHLQEADRVGMFQPDPAVEKYLLEIITRLNGDRKTPSFVKYQPRLSRSAPVNAGALAEGTIVLSPSLLCVVENENQLAAILAHELSHVHLLHGFKGYKEATTNTALANIASLVVGYSSDGNALNTLIINNYSIDLEEEADKAALQLLRQAGYDLSASYRSLERLRISYEGKIYQDPNILQREHPKLQERIEYLKKAIQTEFPGAAGNPAGDDHKAFVRRTLSARRLAVSLLLAKEEYITASAYATETLAAVPEDAGAQLDMGVAIRQWALNFSQNVKDGERTTEKGTSDKAGYKDKPASAHPAFKAPDLDDALPYLRRAAELAPTLFTVERELGEYYAQAGDRAVALEHFQRSLELSPPAREAAKIKRRMQSITQPPPASTPAPATAPDQPANPAANPGPATPKPKE